MKDKKSAQDMLNEVQEVEVVTENGKPKTGILVAVIAFVLVAVFVIMIAVQSAPKQAEIEDPTVVQEGGPSTLVDTESKPALAPVPSTIPYWAKVPYSTFIEDEEMVTEAIAWARKTIGASSMNWLSYTDGSGYTNDVNEQYDAAGILNLNFAYVLREDVEFAFATSVWRLLNPTFGEWESMQYASPGPNIVGQDLKLREMFTREWWASNTQAGDYTRVPIYADWNADSFGGLDMSSQMAPFFYGEIVWPPESKVEVLPDKSGQALLVSMNVKFTGTTTTEIVTKEGVLTLHFVPNPDRANSVPENRFILDQATLVLEGEEPLAPLEPNYEEMEDPNIRYADEREEGEVITTERVYS